jgi:hypothetical protein
MNVDNQRPMMPRAHQVKAWITDGNAGMYDDWRATYIDVMVRNDFRDKSKCSDSSRGLYIYLVVREGFLRPDVWNGKSDRADVVRIRPQSGRSSLLMGADPWLDHDDCKLDCNGATGACKSLYWQVTKLDMQGTISNVNFLTKDRTDEEWILIGFTQDTTTLEVDVGIEGEGGEGFRFFIAVDNPESNDGKNGQARGVTVYMLAGADKHYYREKKDWIDVVYRSFSWKGTFFYMRMHPNLLSGSCKWGDADDQAQCKKQPTLVKMSVTAPGSQGITHSEDAELRSDFAKYAGMYNVAHKLDIGQLEAENLGRATADDPDFGKSQGAPGIHCQDIIDNNSKAKNGYYWVMPTIGSAHDQGGFTGKAFKVFCDMEHFGGGWMLVKQGMGQHDIGAWYSSPGESRFTESDGPMEQEKVLDTDGAHISWRMGDDRINSFEYTTVRMSGGMNNQAWGNPDDNSHLKNSFFWKDCKYHHKKSSAEEGNEKCNRSCEDPECETVINEGTSNEYLNGHMGVGDWGNANNGNDYDHLHSCHDNYAWCIRKVGSAPESQGTDGDNLSCCGRYAHACDIGLWIR